MKINLNDFNEDFATGDNPSNADSEQHNNEGGSPSSNNSNGSRADLEQYQARFKPSITADDINEIANLTKDQRQKLKQDIKSADPEKVFIPASHSGVVCPFCGSGSKVNGTGMAVTPSTNGGWRYKCWACGHIQGDLLEIIATVNQLDLSKDFKKVLALGKKIVENAYNLNFDDIKFDKIKIIAGNDGCAVEELKLIESDIQNAKSNIDNLPEADRRGLSVDTLKRFHVGYIEKFIHPKTRLKKSPDELAKIPASPYIVIPTAPRNFFHYVAVLTPSARNEHNKDFRVMHVGKKEPYILNNGETWRTDKHFIIVEGEIDALSISQALNHSETVVAVGGAAEGKKILESLNRVFESPENRADFIPIIIFDNDDTGIKKSRELRADFLKNGYPAYSALLVDDPNFKIDANDILIGGGNKAQIKAILEEKFSVSTFGGQAVLKSLLEDIIKKAQTELPNNLDAVKNFQAEHTSKKEKGGNTSSKVLTDSDIADAELIQGLTDEEIVEWIKSKLETEQTKSGKRRASCTQYNFDLIFRHDPLVKNLIGYDEFYKQEVFLKTPFWKKNCIGEEWKNSDDSHLRNYLKRTYQNLKGSEDIFDNVVEYSRKNSFHPVKRYLESLHWDGTPRAETFFSKFLNVDDTPYTREITRKWLLGAVSRIYHEGCDFQFALVLHGKQGIGKGYCLRMLGKKWYVSLTDSLDDSHALDTIERAWIVEIPELAAGRKAEINAQKAFLSDNADTRRKAYARRAETTPRHCVFAISVNDEHFLRDLTGNRRFKILESHSKQNEIVEGLTEEYTDQVWAEVFYMYQELFKDGFNDQLLRLSREVDAQADVIAEKHIQDDGLQGEIESFLNTKILPPFIWEHLTKEERRRFTVNACIELKIQELNQRIRAKFGKRINSAQEQIDAIDSYIRENLNTTVAKIESNEQKKPGAIWDEQGAFYRLHGTEERQATCAAEIFNECFGNDKRKNTNRINEVLATLNGWKREEKQVKNFSGVYGNQKNIFWRDKNAENPHHDTTFGDRVSSILDDENFPF